MLKLKIKSFPSFEKYPETEKLNDSKSLERISGIIFKSFYTNQNFSAGILLAKNGVKVPFAGYLYAEEDMKLVLIGFWTKHPRYGRQFRVVRTDHYLNITDSGLKNYLTYHPEIKGIGFARAQKIADKFEKDFEKILLENPEEIAKTCGIKIEIIKQLQSFWLKNERINHVLTWLFSFGLSYKQAKRIIETFPGGGEGAYAVLTRNPYSLIDLISNISFKTVDKIALKMGIKKDDENRIQACLRYCLTSALSQGHSWMDPSRLIDEANTILFLDNLDSKEIITKILEQMLKKGKLYHGTFDRKIIALPNIQNIAFDLFEKFRKYKYEINPHNLIFGHTDQLIGNFKEKYIAGVQNLNEEQLSAIKIILNSSISLIAGGAGSGKSYMICVLKQICEEFNLKVALAAPTGKAARRLSESSGQNASTIHRLLGYAQGKFSFHGKNQLDLDFLIIDEFSMIDKLLAWHLLDAVNLERTAVVFVGDHNQLPPIGPGSLIRDLMNRNLVNSARLTQIVRQAGVLKQNCSAILNGAVSKSLSESLSENYGSSTMSTTHEKVETVPTKTKTDIYTLIEKKPLCPSPWYCIDQITSTLKLQNYLLNIIQRIITLYNNKSYHDFLDRLQVLAPMKKGELGVVSLNEKLQHLFQQNFWGVDTLNSFEPYRDKKNQFFKHDKVIQTKNDYILDVMNGTIGYIVEVDRNQNLLIDFGHYDGARGIVYDGMEPKEIKFGTNQYQNIQLAYALTIHKAQGSEVDCVIVIIHRSQSFMHNRNLLYTGVTRAKETAIIIGDKWAIQRCAKEEMVNDRRTFLSLYGAD